MNLGVTLEPSLCSCLAMGPRASYLISLSLTVHSSKTGESNSHHKDLVIHLTLLGSLGKQW